MDKLASVDQAAMDGLGRLGTFVLSATASLALAFNTFSTAVHSARVALVLTAVLLLHLARFTRISVPREAVIYACFLGYMLVELIWTEDRALALNTIVPAANFLVVLIVFSSLAAIHDLKAMISGSLFGFLAGAAIYARLSGFPFQYPDEFSYNAIAGLYLFGLVLTLLLASIGRWKVPLLVLAAVIGMHIVATTSIKTNLGILLSALAVGVVHFRLVTGLLWRHALAILVIGAAITFSVATNEAAVEQFRKGTDRVALGIRILQAREDLPGYTAFERRTNWQREGFRGWSGNPMFGHGVEAFRSRFGITSHASHVDILYNSGLIGIAFFYGMFASVFRRLYGARHGAFRNARLVVLGGAACYFFMSFAGIYHYSATLAAFLALGIGILKRAGDPARSGGIVANH